MGVQSVNFIEKTRVSIIAPHLVVRQQDSYYVEETQMFGRKIKKSDYSAFTDVQVIRASTKAKP